MRSTVLLLSLALAPAASALDPASGAALGPLQEEASQRKAVPVPKRAEDPRSWRRSDKRNPSLRRHWDTLEGRRAPSIGALTDWMQTDARSWHDLRGKVVLVDFWATWCGPCIRAFPKLKDLHSKYSGQGLEILGLHVASRYEKARVASFVEARRLPWSIAADPTNELSRVCQVNSIPSYFVVDRSGIMRIAGANRDKLEEIVSALLEEPYVPPPAGAPRPIEWPYPMQKQLYARVDLRGKEAPPFAVESWFTEEPERAGKVLILDFWATTASWKKTVPLLNRLQKSYPDELVVVGVSDEDPATVEAFRAGINMNYSLASAPGRAMHDAIGVQSIPHTLIISSDGIVRWQGWPEDPTDPLSASLVRRIIDSDKLMREQKQNPAGAESGVPERAGDE